MSLSKDIGKCRKCDLLIHQCKCHFNTIAELTDDEEPTIEEIIDESALDFIINTGGLPKDIESFQSILQKFYKYVIKPETDKEINTKVLEVLEDIQFNIKGLAHDEIYWLIETKIKPNYKINKDEI